MARRLPARRARRRAESLKQALLRGLYGDAGIDEMRAVKRALDPGWKRAPGVIFSP
jgi:hypothetical protein